MISVKMMCLLALMAGKKPPWKEPIFASEKHSCQDVCVSLRSYSVLEGGGKTGHHVTRRLLW